MPPDSKSLPASQSLLPLSLTTAELAIFNRFWASLKPHDQIALYDLILKAAQHRMAIDNTVHYLTLEAFLLSLVLEQHKEIKRLRNLLDGNGWTS
jgi:hypothetical protein